MSNYADPTATNALGNIEKEFREKKKLALYLRRARRLGLLDDRLHALAKRQLTGIYIHLYREIFRD